MGISTTCCLNLSRPPPTTSSSSSSSIPTITKTTQVGWPNKERSWRSQCALGVAACIIIGLNELDNSLPGRSEGIAVGAEYMQRVVESNSNIGSRWSDKRACPPWRLNSLETIVPENLPRPAARRRWEGVGDSTRIAPAVKVAAVRTGNGSCFTM